MSTTDNIRIKDLRALVSPHLLTDEIPITPEAKRTVERARLEIAEILTGSDDRIVVIVGPCSIHDPKAAIDYANKINALSNKFNNQLKIIMRVYFEKPRTTVGWKGLINDPSLDGSFDVNLGLRTARKLLMEINHLGMPTGSEFLDTMIPQYISDLTSWAAIGARTTESQIHRELASGLSMPVGFKNGTTGNTKIAVDAVCAAQSPHHFLGISKEGIASIVSAMGNPYCHVILRGSNTGPNYDSSTIDEVCTSLEKQNVAPTLMVDCSHGNSNKDYTQQVPVLKAVANQIVAGSRKVFGIMLESNLVEGKQKLSSTNELTYGQSVTDACIGWDETEAALDALATSVDERRKREG